MSSLLEVSCGMINILCEFLSPEECAHPSGFIQPESSMGTSELPKFAPALSQALHLPKLVAIKPVKGYLFSPRADTEQNLMQFKVVVQKTRRKNKGKRQLWQYFILLIKTHLCLQGWAPKGSSLASLQFCWMFSSHHQVLHFLHLKIDHCRDALSKKENKKKGISGMWFPKCSSSKNNSRITTCKQFKQQGLSLAQGNIQT